MKKVIPILLTIAFLFSLAACSGKNLTDAQGNVLPSNLPSGPVNPIKEEFNQVDYAAYYNIFYNEQGSDFENEQITKTGTFAVIRDEWSEKIRYYVWGYSDNTRCCDFQWEFVPEDVNALPPVGSYISVTGTFTHTDDQKTGALDHYWLTDTTLTVTEEYTGTDFDYDLTLMSATLARVQLFSIQNYAEAFADKTVRVYGRIFNENTLQHPYYDEVWHLNFSYDGQTPATGTYVVLEGKITAEDNSVTLEVTNLTQF